MQEETYMTVVTVKSSMKAAEKFIIGIFPNARKDDFNPNLVSFLCKGKDSLMFIHVEEELF